MYGTRHGKRALQWAVTIPRSEGLGRCMTCSMRKNAISSRCYPPSEGLRGIQHLPCGESSTTGPPSPPLQATHGYWVLGMGAMLGHGLSLSPVRRDSGVYGTRHGERDLQWVVAISRSHGLRGCGTRSMRTNAISSRHSPPPRKTRGYPALGMGRMLGHGPSPSPSRRDSGVSGTRHGENARPRAVDITRSEGLGGCGTRSMRTNAISSRHYPPLKRTLGYPALGMRR